MKSGFSLLVKPVSWHCNLRCRYCFYLSRSAVFGQASRRMDLPVLEAMLRRFAASKMPCHRMDWQGGEPTLAGLDFFEAVCRLQRQLFPVSSNVVNSLQTNGLLIDDQWAELLAQKRFLVGVSLDGPEPFHDQYRRTEAGGGSHAQVLAGVKALLRHQVMVNVLTVVSAANVQEPETLFHHFGELGLHHQQYIECADMSCDGNRLPWAISAEQWGDFLCRLFDVWYIHGRGEIHIRLFDSILSRLATGIPSLCAMGGDCRHYFVVEQDGSVYPCDFHVSTESCLGNVMEHDFRTLQQQRAYVDFGRQKAPVHEDCRSCRWLPLCMGDCPRNRGVHGKSRLCTGWKQFYGHTIARFEQLADAVK